jgi:hypothetical protein
MNGSFNNELNEALASATLRSYVTLGFFGGNNVKNLLEFTFAGTLSSIKFVCGLIRLIVVEFTDESALAVRQSQRVRSSHHR